MWHTGTLVQHIESLVAHEVKGGKPAHEVPTRCRLRLAADYWYVESASDSSHHQSADVPGDGLRVVAKSPQNGVIEAIEGGDPKHFVLAVQWHPERHFDEEAVSQKLFRGIVEQAAKYKPKG